MTLLELLRQELPKRGGWPEGVAAMAQDADGAVQNYVDTRDIRINYEFAHGKSRIACSYSIGSGECEVSTDRLTAIVTREQYEAALAAKNDGWIEWGGGEYPPVSTNTVVDVKLRCGSVTVQQPAGIMNWRSNASDEPGDIIAYRLHQMQEADLNECIGQDAAPVWNGEGLPPVGCEIEYMKYQRGHNDDWFIGTINYISDFTVVISQKGHEGEIVGHPVNFQFRPLRTEAERAIDEMVRLSGVSIGAAKILYDAGYRKG